MLDNIRLLDLRGYASLDATFGPGPHLVFGPNAAGKTSLLEAMVLLAWGRSHRTTTDGELIRWGTDLARVEGRVGADTIEVAIVRAGAAGTAGRKRIRVNGLGRRAAGLAGLLRVVLFAPEEMLLIAGSPGLRRAVIDQLATTSSPAYADAFATYARTLQQRNSLLRAIREEGASRDELRFWDGAFLDAGGAIVTERRRLLETLAGPLAAAHAEIAPDEAAAARLTIRYETNAPPLPGESARDALARRLAETAEKEVWNGSTLVGPHRDDLVFELGRPGPRDLRLARPAADRHPRPQARRARRRHGARRPPAAAPPRRRLLRARPGAPVAPRPPDRGAAPGVRDDHHAGRSRSRAARDRDGLGGPHRPRRGATRAERLPVTTGGQSRRRRGPRPMTTPRKRPMVRLGDLIPTPRGRWGSRTNYGCRARSRRSRRWSPSGSRPRRARAG